MNNIIEVAKNKKAIMADQNIYCPMCSQKQFAPFDKLYTKTYGECVDCTATPEDVGANSNNIFAIIKQL